MDHKMKIANLVADNIKGFMELVYKNQMNKKNLVMSSDKVFQIRLFMEEFRFKVTADELKRINRFCWNEKYTLLLVNDFHKGLDVIEEYVKRNYDDLFVFTARIHTLKNLCLLLRKEGER
ncbi:hypothetical protein [Bacillus massiliigorillae]|uniref:hypothetical protein n=1 Tax=Bacillus massiliigorillae TaxID=1243664 RepID=UPI0003A7B768|nr:hypothetical protein [Bacillus massiliigorillae]